MRWVVLVVIAACGRVGFDTDVPPSGDAMIDGPAESDYLVWLPFDDDPSDARMRGPATCASCAT